MSSNQVGERLHLTGFVGESIVAVAESYCRALGGTSSEVWHDPLQRVRVSFIHSRHAGEPSIELVEPADPASPVQKFLESGGGLHHLLL